jgi:hypothetical protein
VLFEAAATVALVVFALAVFVLVAVVLAVVVALAATGLAPGAEHLAKAPFGARQR